MSLSTLPQPIKAFLRATASRDRAGVLSSLADDAVLIDMGKEHRGEQIAHWTDNLYAEKANLKNQIARFPWRAPHRTVLRCSLAARTDRS